MADRDFKAEELGNGEVVNRSEKIWKVEELGENPEFQTTTTTYLDSNGTPVTEEEAVVYRAGCGHWVGYEGPQELIGTCAVCGTSLCHRCGNSTGCFRCGIQPLCPTCSRVGQIAQEVPGPDGQVLKVAQQVYCPNCFRFFLAGRVARSIFGGIHRLLSRDITNG